MKNESNVMRVINNIINVIIKFTEIVYWCAAVACVVFFFLALSGNHSIFHFLTYQPDSLSGNGLSIIFTNKITEADYNIVYPLFFFTNVIVCILFAKVFRYINLTFKTAQGKTKYSEGETFFQKKNVEFIQKIGFLSIGMIAVEIIMQVIIKVALGDAVTVFVNYTPIHMGIVILCLSQFFAQAINLQKDVDGLL